MFVLQTIASRGWILAVRGALAFLFACFLIAPTGIGIAFAVLAFGLYVITDGAVMIWISDLGRDRWWAALLHGIVNILAGVGILIGSSIHSFPLIYLIAAWAVVIGILDMAAAVRLRDVMRCQGLMILAGILSLGFSAVLLAYRFPDRPLITALVETIWTALYTGVLGLVLLFLAFILRRVRGIHSDRAT